MSNTIKNKVIKATQETVNDTDNIKDLLAPYITLEIPNPLNPQFEEPKRYGDYTRLEDGDNVIRILSEGIIGCEYWTEEFDQASGKSKRKPVRRPITEATTLDCLDWAYFHAFFVWNYKAKKLQILNTAKRGVIKGLKQLAKNAKWGDSTSYDINISRVQTNSTDPMSVEYSVTPEPKAVLDPEIAEKWEASGFTRNDLFLLFEGLDPFELQREARRQEQESIRNTAVKA
jgi:hypothetical protein